MMSPSSPDAWKTRVCLPSVNEPDADTGESWRLFPSSNAPFDTQLPDLRPDRVDTCNSSAVFRSWAPNLPTEFHQLNGDSRCPCSHGGSLDTDGGGSPFDVVCCPLTISPVKWGIPGCSESNGCASNTLSTESCTRPHGDGQECSFEFLVQNLGQDGFSGALSSHFDLNSAQLNNTFIQIDPCSKFLWPSNDDFEEGLTKDLRCDWPQCSSLASFETIEKHKTHLKQHARDVSNNWNPGMRCTWHKCGSKASHQSRNLFEAHLNNIHLNPLLCTVKHCKHKTPFRANHDLERHISTAHNIKSKYECPYMTCVGRAFIRKDKWMSHLKGHHDTEPCPYEHCQHRIENIPFHQRSVSRHIGKSHSNFECALKSCKGKVSRFKESQLLEHLQLHHEMEWVLVLKARDMMKADGDRTLTSDYIVQDLSVRDCKICIEGS